MKEKSEELKAKEVLELPGGGQKQIDKQHEWEKLSYLLYISLSVLTKEGSSDEEKIQL